MSHTRCSSCASLPCSCSPSTDPTEGCSDPGLVAEGSALSVLDDEMCDSRLLPFRGLDQNGDQIIDPNEPLVRAYVIQNAAGKIIFTDEPCIPPPVLQMTVDESGYGTTGPDFWIGQSSDCQVAVKGPVTSSGFMFWDSDAGRWVMRPGLPVIVPAAECVKLDAALALIAGTQNYTFTINGDTGPYNVNGTINIGIYTFVITTLARSADLSQAYIGAKLDQTISGAPVILSAGSCVYWSGFAEQKRLNIDATPGAVVFSRSNIFTTDASVLDLTTVAGYTADATHVILFAEASLSVVNARQSVGIMVQNFEYATATVDSSGGSADNSNDSSYFFVTIPPDKKITISHYVNTIAMGTGSCFSAVNAMGWINKI